MTKLPNGNYNYHVKNNRNTKEEILNVALELFGSKGYDATSLSDISSRLSLTKASIFKHFGNKEEILDGVLKMMDKIDSERAREMDVPVHKAKEAREEYERVEKKAFLNFALSQFDYWTEDKKGKEYRRFLSIERFNRPLLKKKWDENFVSGPMEYTRDVLVSLKISEPDRKAFLLWGGMFLSYSLFDVGQEKEGLRERLEKEIKEILEV